MKNNNKIKFPEVTVPGVKIRAYNPKKNTFEDMNLRIMNKSPYWISSYGPAAMVGYDGTLYLTTGTTRYIIPSKKTVDEALDFFNIILEDKLKKIEKFERDVQSGKKTEAKLQEEYRRLIQND